MKKSIFFSVACFVFLFPGCATDKTGEPVDLFQGIANKKYAASVDVETEQAEGRNGLDVSVSCEDTVKVTFAADNLADKQYKYKVGNATGRYILKQGSGKIAKKSWTLTVDVDESQQGHVYAASIELPSADDYARSYVSCP